MEVPPQKSVLTYSVVLPSGPFKGNEKIVVPSASGDNITIPLKNLPGFKPGGKVIIKQNTKDKRITVNYDKIPSKASESNNLSQAVKDEPTSNSNNTTQSYTNFNNSNVTSKSEIVETSPGNKMSGLIGLKANGNVNRTSDIAPEVDPLSVNKTYSRNPMTNIVRIDPQTMKRPYLENSDDEQPDKNLKENFPIKKKTFVKSRQKPMGVSYCCVNGCRNQFGRYIEEIAFPLLDKERCAKWVELTENQRVKALFESDDPDFEHFSICEFHFSEEDFLPTFPRRPKDKIIPSLFGDEAWQMKEKIIQIKKKIENASKRDFPHEYLPKQDIQGRRIIYWPMDVPVPVDPENQPDTNHKRTIGSIYPNGKPFSLEGKGDPLKFLQQPNEVDELKKELETQKDLVKHYAKMLQENGIDSSGKFVGNAPGQEILALKQKVVSLNLTVKKHENTQRELRREITILRDVEKSHRMCRKTITTMQAQLDMLRSYKAAADDAESALPTSKAQVRIRNLENQNSALKNMLQNELKKNNKKLVIKLKKFPVDHHEKNLVEQDPLSLESVDLNGPSHQIIYEQQNIFEKSHAVYQSDQQEIHHEIVVQDMQPEIVMEEGTEIPMQHGEGRRHPHFESEEVDLGEEGEEIDEDIAHSMLHLGESISRNNAGPLRIP